MKCGVCIYNRTTVRNRNLENIFGSVSLPDRKQAKAPGLSIDSGTTAEAEVPQRSIGKNLAINLGSSLV